MTAHLNVFSNNQKSGNGIVSAAKAIIETHVAAERYYNYSGKIIKDFFQPNMSPLLSLSGM